MKKLFFVTMSVLVLTRISTGQVTYSNEVKAQIKQVENNLAGRLVIGLRELRPARDALARRVERRQVGRGQVGDVAVELAHGGHRRRTRDVGRLRRELTCEGQSRDLRVSVQHRDIFEAVNRVNSF